MVPSKGASEEHTQSVLEQLLPERELAWLVVGVHEAGHMIAAFDGGLEVDYTEIHQGWFTSTVEGVVWYKPGQEFTHEDLLPRLTSCLAGGVAHERFLIEYGIRASAASREARESSDFDLMNFAYMARELEGVKGENYSREHVRSRAQEVVDRRWHSIVLLGTVICEKKRLSAAQAERVAG